MSTTRNAGTVRAAVNVSSVPQLSPFRYPGGKTWLIPTVRQWFTSLDETPALLIEPFTGGGIVSLTAMAEGLADRALMVELDHDVAQRIMDFDCTVDNVHSELATTPQSTRHRAFQTIVRNRTNHGGNMAPGSGSLKSGERGKGIGSRWYPATLARRLVDINAMSYRIDFIEGDGLEVMTQHADRSDVAFFVDPPYTASGKRAGRRLYRHHELDHQRLFALAMRVEGNLLMTYDEDSGARRLAGDHGFEVGTVAMCNTQHRTMNELVIGRDLSWMGSEPLVTAK
jgi:DNA adenine methylase